MIPPAIQELREHNLPIAKGVLFALLLFFSTWRLPDSPATWFDEGINLGVAKSWIQRGVYSLETSPGEFVTQRPFLITTDYPVIVPVALALKLFGLNLTAARVPMVFYLLFFTLVAYLLIKKWHGEIPALWGVALVITFAPFYGNGKAVLGEVPGMFYFLLGLLVLPRDDAFKKLFLSGVLFGLSAATKPFFLVVIAAVAIGETLAHRQDPPLLWKRLGALGLGGLVPLLLWLLTILSPFTWATFARAIRYYSNSYAAQDFTALLAHNLTRFVSETTPAHFFVLLLICIWAIYARKRRGSSVQAGELIAWVFVIINALWYLKTPGWYRYFFTAHLVLLLAAPASLLLLLPKKWASVILAVLVAVQFGYLLTKSHDPLYVSDGARRFTQYLDQHVSSGASVFIINSPSIAFLLHERATIQYLQINQILHFGPDSLAGKTGQLAPYVATNGSVENVEIPGIDATLRERYRVAWEGGHYVLYERL